MTSLIANTKRQRVRGSGPNRNQMVTFAKIGNVSTETLEKLNEIADSKTGNDLGTDIYNISKQCNVDEIFIKTGYRQILIQERENNVETADEHMYTKYNESVNIPYFKQIYRLRISEMEPGNEMNWHIDADTSVICRAQICLNENDSIFQFKRKGILQEFSMKVGEVWFINTGWLHRVVSNKLMRRSAIFGFDYRDYTGNTPILL